MKTGSILVPKMKTPAMPAFGLILRHKNIWCDIKWFDNKNKNVWTNTYVLSQVLKLYNLQGIKK